MAGGMDFGTSSKGGRKALDAAINLVPFIDLMAVTISFLIMTAVWTQIGRLQVSSSGTASSEEPDKELTVPLTLLITDRELKLTTGGSASEPMPLVRDAKGRLDLQKLKEKLGGMHNTLPAQQSITLKTEDSVKYDDLVRIIDECIGAGLPSVQVSPAMG